MDKEIKPPFLRTPYNYDRNKAGDESGLDCKDPSLTQQQFAEEADINVMVERFHLTGEMPQLTNLPSSQDYDGIFDFQSAMNTIVAAQRQFMTLPAKTRAYFENDPQQFLEFFQDPANKPEAIRLGLVATPLAPPEPKTPHGAHIKPEGDKKDKPKGGKPAPDDGDPQN